MSEEITPYGLTDMQSEQCDKAAADAHQFIRNAVSGAIKKITDDLHQGIHDYVMDIMESDLRFNFADLVRCRVNEILQGLLSGGWHESTAKKWLCGYDFEKYRHDIYLEHKDIIQNKLLDDLIKENARLEEQLKWARR